ncbi:hypothetical protein H8356DRAFT_937376 [Neocallimastix lanati (nom. inval.)]|nr:hypothetical protein H8356DRAFT_937376 [Neocallimastix sp. JGI-2020a]
MVYYWSPYLTSYLVGGAVPAGLPYKFLCIGAPYPSIITACHCTVILQLGLAATISVITRYVI